MSSASFSAKQLSVIRFAVVCLSVIVIFFVGQIIAALMIGVSIALINQLGANLNTETLFASDSYGPIAFASAYTAVVIMLLMYAVVRLLDHKYTGSFKKLARYTLLTSTPMPIKFSLFGRSISVRGRARFAAFLPVIAFVAYGYYILVSLGVRIILTVLNVIDVSQEQQLGFDTPGSASGLVFIFITIVVLPPIWEEILFRGYLFNTLKRFGSRFAAYAATSLLFGLAHIEGSSLNWIAVVDTAVFSVFLIYVTERYNSLYPAIALHALKNGIAFAILFAI